MVLATGLDVIKQPLAVNLLKVARRGCSRLGRIQTFYLIFAPIGVVTCWQSSSATHTIEVVPAMQSI